MTVKWIAGPPSGEGRYWVVWNFGIGTSVEAVEVSPALAHRDKPGAPLLLKTLTGAAYRFENARHAIKFHAWLSPPEMPR